MNRSSTTRTACRPIVQCLPYGLPCTSIQSPAQVVLNAENWLASIG
jgi:hypothetical protein